jgi:hypothetical protein
MANLDLVALVVRDYDPAIRLFLDVLEFELAEDIPSLTNDGHPKRWVVVRRLGARPAFCLHAPMGVTEKASLGSSSLDPGA